MILPSETSIGGVGQSDDVSRTNNTPQTCSDSMMFYDNHASRSIKNDKSKKGLIVEDGGGSLDQIFGMQAIRGMSHSNNKNRINSYQLEQ